MKKCLKCNVGYSSADQRCPKCSYEPGVQLGFPTYAPALAHEGGGFQAGYFETLATLEEMNFWFRARNSLIVWALSKYCADFQSFLEIGCGTGYVLSGIAKAYPHARLQGSELFVAGLSYAAERQPDVNFIQMDARCIPFVEEFDVIGAFDVLEHIKEDETVLAQIHNALNPSGVIVLTVPQHTWLWSPIDDYACHVRRYSARDMHTKLENANFEILRSTSFVSLLLLLMWMSRFTKKGDIDESDALMEFRIHPWLNNLLEAILSAEVGLIKRGVNFAFGGSRLVVARKLS